MSKYEKNRKQYESLYYYGFEMEEAPAIGDIPAKLTITYDFEIPGYGVFAPQWEIPCDVEDMASDEKIIDLIFLLGMAELFQCFKTVCPKNVIVEPFLLSDNQADMFKKHWFKALRDFYRLNEIDENEKDFLNIFSQGEDEVQLFFHNQKECAAQLIPLQGKNETDIHKDALTGNSDETVFFLVNATEEILKEIQNKGYDKLICVCRQWNEHKLAVDNEDSLRDDLNIRDSILSACRLVSYLYGLKMSDRTNYLSGE